MEFEGYCVKCRTKRIARAMVVKTSKGGRWQGHLAQCVVQP